MNATATELTGVQKAAVVIMNLPPEVAAEVLKNLDETEAEEVTAEIVRLRKVDADVAEAALVEFSDIAHGGRLGIRGGQDVASDLLSAAFGTEKAAGMLGRVTSSMAGRSFEFLDAVEPSQVAALLDGEMPQTAALVLAHLRPAHASAILSTLSDHTRVAEAIATMDAATPETVQMIATSLRDRSAVVAPRAAAEVVGGVQPLVEIINRATVETEKAVLAGLDEINPELAEEIRSRLLTFADIVRLDPRDIQKVLRGIDIGVLALAMKGSPEAVQSVIRDNISEANREALTEEQAVIGSVRTSQVEEARADVVRAVRELEQSGEITVQRAEEEALID